MKVAIMQPYLFPYIGYFQLIKAVDTFVIYDDVQYIKSGWINRNRILVNDSSHLFSFSLKKSSSYTQINQRYFSNKFIYEKNKFFKLINSNYRKSPHYIEVMTMIEKTLDVDIENHSIAQIIGESLKIVCAYLDINTRFIASSDIKKNVNLKGEERVIDINKQLHADVYINSIGGKELYSKETFLTNGLQLYLLQPNHITYQQKDGVFVPRLSIIDVMMFNTRRDIKNMLQEYELI